jgi:beta-galactosidase
MKAAVKTALPKVILCVFFLLSWAGVGQVQAKPLNDDLFPPGPAAAKFSDFDGRGFIINGQRTFIVSGSVHYPRVPREDWREVLLKLKRAGFNTVQTYVFWNYHEAHEGQFDFTSDSRDLGAFLDTAKEVGLYAIVRVGPYVCAEWENGGFPNWLYFKPGLEIRKDNKPFLTAMDAWFKKMLPIVSSRQIQNGGNVIWVQLENEYPAEGWKYWGTAMDGQYFQHLLDLAHENGIEVPMFFSGLNHAHDPMPTSPVDSTKRTSPWMSTELWTIWFDRYGETERDILKGDRSTWRVLAEGGNGFNLYMAYGGTTFGFFNFSDVTEYHGRGEEGMTCYDYGTLIGQTGDLRPLYYRLKRLGYFAGTFSPILADSTNSTAQYQDFASGVKVTARTAPGGTLVFLDNGSPAKPSGANDHAVTAPDNATNIVLKSGTHISLAKGEIVGLPVNFSLAPGLTIAEADTRILGIVQQGATKTMICYGEPGDIGKIYFQSEFPASAKIASDGGFKLDEGKTQTLSFDFVSNRVEDEMLNFGTNQLRVLVMSKATADQTWIVDTAAGRQIVVGAPYLGDFSMKVSGKIRATVNYPWNDPAPKTLTVYDGAGVRQVSLSTPSLDHSPATLALSSWQMSADNAPLAKDFDDHGWFSSSDGNPPAIGQDGDNSPYAWYHVRLTNNTPVTSMKFKRIGDRASFFVDGKLGAVYDLQKDKGNASEVTLDMPSGVHELAVFVAHAGRPKYVGYIGSINQLKYQKGLRGPVTINGKHEAILGWKMRGGVSPDKRGRRWFTLNAVNTVPAYYRCDFKLDQLPAPGAEYRFHADGLSHGCVWLNGHNLGLYPEIVKNCPGLWLPSCWLKKGKNTLVVFDEHGNSPEKTSIQMEVSASRQMVRTDN